MASGLLPAAELPPPEERGGLETADLILALPASLPHAGTGQIEVEAASELSCPSGTVLRTLVVSLDEAMPPGMHLEISVAGPGSPGSYQPMTANGRTLTLLLPASTRSRLPIRYRFRHDITAPPGSFSRNLIFTLIDS